MGKDTSESTPTTESAIPTGAIPSINKIKSVVDTISTGDMTPEECCERVGLTLERVYRRLSGLMDAKMVQRSGGAEYEVPDNKTRMVAVQLVLELRRHIKDKTNAVSVGIFNDPRLAEDASRVLSLRGGERYSDGSNTRVQPHPTRTNGGSSPPLSDAVGGGG